MEHQMAKLMKAILAQSESIKALQAKSDAIHSVVEEIRPAVFELQRWKPEMESSVEGLRSEVGKLRTQVAQITRNPVLAIRPGELPPILPLPETKPEFGPETEFTPLGKKGSYVAHGEWDARAIGHQDESNPWGKTIGERFSPLPLLGNGTFPHSDGSNPVTDYRGGSFRHQGHHHPHHFPPKTGLPTV